MAPIALVVFAITALIIIASAGGDDHKSSSAPSRAEQRDLRLKKQRAHTAQTQSRIAQRGVYIVKTGDTLGAIAQKTGVPVEKLQQLNPNLDPQSLLSGQRIKLR
jgi:LysM repeat protein